MTAPIRAGGMNEDIGRSVATLDDGSGIVAGWFVGTTSFGDLALSEPGLNAFVAKFDASGTWVWASEVKGGFSSAFSVAVLDDGSAIVVGYFEDPATFGSTTLTSTGREDVFVAKVDEDGAWVWATKAGSTNSDYAYGVSVLSDGSAIVTGSFRGSASFGTTTLVSAGGDDIFVAKIDADGSWLWAQKAGSTGGDEGFGVSGLADGGAVVSGTYSGSASFGTTTLASAGSLGDAFVARIDASGTWMWAVSATSTTSARFPAVAASSDGSAIVAGRFAGSDVTLLPAGGGPAVVVTNPGTLAGGVVAKVDADGDWVWALAAGSGNSGDMIAESVAVSSDGSALVAGRFTGSATFGTDLLVSAGSADVFVARVSTSGSWVWATRAGSEADARGQGVAAAGDGGAYVTGGFTGSATFGATTLTSAGNRDVFVAMVDATGAWVGGGSAPRRQVPDGLSASCVPSSLVVGSSVTCAVSGGDPGIDILWRAAYNPVFAEAGVTLDDSGAGEFSFTVPAAALGRDVTVELVEWLAPVSLGVVAGPVPMSVPSGGGPMPVWPLVALVLIGGSVLRRRPSTQGVRLAWG